MVTETIKMLREAFKAKHGEFPKLHYENVLRAWEQSGGKIDVAVETMLSLAGHVAAHPTYRLACIFNGDDEIYAFDGASQILGNIYVGELQDGIKTPRDDIAGILLYVDYPDDTTQLVLMGFVDDEGEVFWTNGVKGSCKMGVLKYNS